MKSVTENSYFRPWYKVLAMLAIMDVCDEYHLDRSVSRYLVNLLNGGRWRHFARYVFNAAWRYMVETLKQGGLQWDEREDRFLQRSMASVERSD